MNSILFKAASVLLSFTAVIVSGGLKAEAQTSTQPKNLHSASALMAEDSNAQNLEVSSKTTSAVIAQVDGTTPDTTPEPSGVAPGRATRSGPSYIGIGGNIGIGGETTISEGAFSVFSKIGFTNTLSARPAALIGDNAVFLLPVTVDFPLSQGELVEASIAPYIGGGIAISTGQDSTVGALITGGIDVPLSQQFTATGSVNVGFIDETEVGLLLGVGYNF